MVSSGIRVGAWNYLRWKDVDHMTNGLEVIAAKLIIYPGDHEEYYIFIILILLSYPLIL